MRSALPLSPNDIPSNIFFSEPQLSKSKSSSEALPRSHVMLPKPPSDSWCKPPPVTAPPEVKQQVQVKNLHKSVVTQSMGFYPVSAKRRKKTPPLGSDTPTIVGKNTPPTVGKNSPLPPNHFEIDTMLASITNHHRTTDTCTGCYQFGHNIKVCPSSDKECFTCKLKGHLNRNCPTSTKNQRTVKYK